MSSKRRIPIKLTPIDREWIDKLLRAMVTAEAGPSEADLAQAPVLSDWKAAISPGGHVILWGKVVDHPLLGTTNLTTSLLIAINPEDGWARTASPGIGSAGPSTRSKRN